MRNDELNYDPDGFKRWLFKVAVNAKNDFVKKARRIQFIESGELDEKIADNNNQVNIISDESPEKLNKAFETVINADVRAYKVLTWLAQMIIIVIFDVTKIESYDIIEKNSSLSRQGEYERSFFIGNVTFSAIFIKHR